MANIIGMSQQPSYVGPIGSTDQQLTYKSGDNPWSSFFGPSKGPIETAPYGSYRRENFALPDAYRGSNMYLTNIIITLVTEGDLWPVTIAMPWRLTESEMEIAWDQIIFDNTLLGQVPEEGVSRLVTQQVSERRDHYVRYGLAFMLEHGFMKTDRGRLCYRMNLEQIRNAILETAYLGVLDAYLRCKRPSFLGGIRTGMQRLTSRGLQRALAEEVEQFAQIQKNEYGFDLMDAAGKKALKLIGVTPNLWILPEGMKMYLNLVRKENFQFALTGDSSGNRIGDRKDVAVDVAKDCMVVETKCFELPNQAEPLDPMQRPASIGEYYTMFNHLRGSAHPGSHRSVCRDIFIYNEDKDGFTRISLDMALNNCGRFDRSGNLDVRGKPAPSSGAPPDMFITPNTTDPCEHMGDMHPQYLRDAGLNDWADSVVAKILSNNPAGARAIRDGVDLCRRIDATTSTTGVQKTWLMWLWLSHTLPRSSTSWSEEHGLPLPHTYEDVLPWIKAGEPDAPEVDAAGAPKYKRPFWAELARGSTDNAPLMDYASQSIKAMPVGYANYPGLCVLAMKKYETTFGEVHTIAKNFVAAFESLYSELTAHSHESVFMDGGFAPPWLKARDGRSTFFSNVLYVSHAPIWLKLDTAASRYPTVPPSLGVKLDTAIFGTDAARWTIPEGDKLAYYKTVPAELLKSETIAQAYLTIVDNIKEKYDSNIDTDKPGTDENYADYIRKKAQAIKSVLAVGADGDLKQAIDETVARFTALLLRPELSLMHTSKVSMGVLFANTLLHLIRETKAKEVPVGSDETSSMIGTLLLARAVSISSVAGFMSFVLNAWMIVTDSEKNKLQWATAGDGVRSLRDDLDNTVPKPADTYNDIKDTLEPTQNGGQVLLPDVATQIKGGDAEYYVPTHLTGSSAMAFAIFKSDLAAIVTVAADPATPHHGSTMDLHTSPPIFGVRGPAMHHRDEEMPTYGAPSRFGARSAEEFTKRRRIDAMMDAARAEGVDDALTHDPWGNGAKLRKFSAAFSERWHQISRMEMDPMKRAAKLVYLGQPVTQQTLAKNIAMDDVLPFGFILFRPYQTYNMASAILTVAGASTGETLVGHADFQLADNVVQKMHLGNFTMYLKSVVYQPQHVWIAPNVMACGYVGGGNCEFRQPSGKRDPPNTPTDPSMFSVLVPYDAPQEGSQFANWEQELPNPMDITGRYQMSNPALAQLGNSVQRDHYACSQFYRELYGWNNDNGNAMDEESMGVSNRYNTLCFQGHQAAYDPTSGRYDLVTECSGHRGNRIYPGCGKVWRGLAKVLEPVNHKGNFGSGPNRSIVTLGQ